MKGLTVKSFLKYPIVLAVFDGYRLIDCRRFKIGEEPDEWFEKFKQRYPDKRIYVIEIWLLDNYLWSREVLKKEWERIMEGWRRWLLE